MQTAPTSAPQDPGFQVPPILEMFEQNRSGEGVREVTTSDGDTGTVSDKASFGSLSSGGLY